VLEREVARRVLISFQGVKGDRVVEYCGRILVKGMH
jgi:hypothetical protein